jgi:hypothetical protein
VKAGEWRVEEVRRGVKGVGERLGVGVGVGELMEASIGRLVGDGLVCAGDEKDVGLVGEVVREFVEGGRRGDVENLLESVMAEEGGVDGGGAFSKGDKKVLMARMMERLGEESEGLQQEELDRIADVIDAKSEKVKTFAHKGLIRDAVKLLSKDSPKIMRNQAQQNDAI